MVPTATVLLTIVSCRRQQLDVASRLADEVVDLEREADVHDTDRPALPDKRRVSTSIPTVGTPVR